MALKSPSPEVVTVITDAADVVYSVVVLRMYGKLTSSNRVIIIIDDHL